MPSVMPHPLSLLHCTPSSFFHPTPIHSLLSHPTPAPPHSPLTLLPSHTLTLSISAPLLPTPTPALLSSPGPPSHMPQLLSPQSTCHHPLPATPPASRSPGPANHPVANMDVRIRSNEWCHVIRKGPFSLEPYCVHRQWPATSRYGPTTVGNHPPYRTYREIVGCSPGPATGSSVRIRPNRWYHRVRRGPFSLEPYWDHRQRPTTSPLWTRHCGKPPHTGILAGAGRVLFFAATVSVGRTASN